MDEFRKKVFYQKFAFLSHVYLHGYNPKHISVKRIDRDVLLRWENPAEEDRAVYIVVDDNIFKVQDDERPIDTIYRLEEKNVDAIVAVEGDNSFGYEFTVYLPKEDIPKLISALEKRAEIEVRNEVESC